MCVASWELNQIKSNQHSHESFALFKAVYSARWLFSASCPWEKSEEYGVQQKQYSNLVACVRDDEQPGYDHATTAILSTNKAVQKRQSLAAINASISSILVPEDNRGQDDSDDDLGKRTHVNQGEARTYSFVSTCSGQKAVTIMGDRILFALWVIQPTVLFADVHEPHNAQPTR